MDELASKAILIGVSVFITIMITTMIIFEFTEIKKVYRVTSETDVTFEQRLDEFDKFKDSNNVFNGIDVLNTINKYKNEKAVKVCMKIRRNNTMW